MPQADSDQRTPWWFLPFVAVLFFFLLGTRSLNEPDEGRYAEIAREMVETGNWLVPHIWYVPHLDKPPFTYWAVATSLSLFGVNEWAARLPLALAGLSAAWATFLLVRSVAGAVAARWSVLVLGTSALYWVMARMLTTDIFLTQFIAWAVYFFWRSWRSLDALMERPAAGGPQPATPCSRRGEEADASTSAESASSPRRLQPESLTDEPDPAGDARAFAARRSFAWQLAAWAAMAGGALTKGPIALVIPLAAFGALLWWRRKTDGARLSVLLFGALAGVPLFATLALPWFWMVWENVPHAFEFMVRGQIVGHAVQAAAKNRAQPFWFFVPVLIGGFLPWTLLLGWLWRRAHWRSLDARTQEAWLLLSVWAGGTFVLFSLNSAKLMHYILPMFPALAALVALRWRDFTSSDLGAVLPHPNPLPLGEGSAMGTLGEIQCAVASPPQNDILPLPAGEGRGEGEHSLAAPLPRWVWRALPAGALLPLIAFPLVCRFVFKVEDQLWVKFTPLAAGLTLVVVAWESRKWPASLCARWACGVAAISLFAVVAVTPLVETELRSNQTFKPLGLALRREFREGDLVIVRQRIPQGLPFYAHPAISAVHRPHMSGLPEHRMPFEFPGNRERFGDRVIKDDHIYGNLLAGRQRVLVVGVKGSFISARPLARGRPLRLLAEVGGWELFTNQ